MGYRYGTWDIDMDIDVGYGLSSIWDMGYRYDPPPYRYGHPGYRYGIWDIDMGDDSIDMVIQDIDMGYLVTLPARRPRSPPPTPPRRRADLHTSRHVIKYGIDSPSLSRFLSYDVMATIQLALRGVNLFP